MSKVCAARANNWGLIPGRGSTSNIFLSSLAYFQTVLTDWLGWLAYEPSGPFVLAFFIVASQSKLQYPVFVWLLGIQPQDLTLGLC